MTSVPVVSDRTRSKEFWVGFILAGLDRLILFLAPTFVLLITALYSNARSRVSSGPRWRSRMSALCWFFCIFGMHFWQGLIQPLPVYQLSLFHAVVNTMIPAFLIMWSVARIGAPMTAQLGLLGSVSVLFLANWILGEPIRSLQLLGTAFALVGAVVLARR
ncbi:MAG: DMT family transporter [Burkholderiaceae bacterium]